MGQGQSIDAGQVAAALGGRSVVLVGMMGAGKTSVGKRLAAKLGLPFVDADAEIEAGAQLTDFRDLRAVRRGLFPRGRTQGDRPPAHQRAGGAGDRRRRVHERDNAGEYREAWRFDLAEAQLRRSACQGAKEVQPAAVEDRRPRSRRCVDCCDERSPIYALADFTIESLDAAHDSVVEAIFQRLAWGARRRR